MNNKKLIIIFLLTSMVFISIIPTMNFVMNNSNNHHKSLFNIDVIESYVNYLAFNKLNLSLMPDKVIVGKNGFLFLGNKYNNIIRKSQNLFEYSKVNIGEWTDSLKELQTRYEDKGIKFVFVVAPNKHSIYSENLPSWVKYEDHNLTDKVFKSAKHKGVNMLDIRPNLLKRKNQSNEPLYLRSDSHWNRIGGSIAYNETIKFLNNKYNAGIEIPPYTYRNHEVYKGGKDLADLLKIKSKLPNNYEDEIRIQFNQPHRICLGEIDTESLEMLPCVDKSNPSYSISKKFKYTINKAALNKTKVLVIADSFATNNSQLYSQTFMNLWKAYQFNVKGDKLNKIIDKFKPEIVIYQIVERNFYNIDHLLYVSEIKNIKKKPLNTDNKVFDLLSSQSKFSRNNHFNIQEKQIKITGKDPQIVLKYTKTKAKKVLLSVQIESPHNSQLQLFYKTKINEVYNKKNSFFYPIKKGANTILIEMPAKYINNELRVDITNKVGSYKLNEFSIIDLK